MTVVARNPARRGAPGALTKKRSLAETQRRGEERSGGKLLFAFLRASASLREKLF